jgi:hypothetical protein
MAELTITKTYTAGGLSDETQLDHFETDIQDFFNVTKLTPDSIQPSSLTTAKITDVNVTLAKVEALGQQVSAEVTSYSSASTSPLTILAAPVTISTTGRPVVISLIPGASGPSFVGVTTSVVNPTAIVDISSNGTVISTVAMQLVAPGGNPSTSYFPPSAIFHLDTPITGTYSYDVLARVIGANDTFNAENFHLMVYEIS